jgi:hypothetical protein
MSIRKISPELTDALNRYAFTCREQARLAELYLRLGGDYAATAELAERRAHDERLRLESLIVAAPVGPEGAQT